MRKGECLSLMIACWGALSLACASSDRAAAPTDVPKSAATSAADERTPRAGWQFLRTGMSPDQVYTELGGPRNIHVDMMFTLWFYSDRGESGPHVQFDTKTMKVVRWRQ